MILIDTNVFLELLLGRKGASQCKALLDGVSRGEQDGIVTRFAIHSVEAILGRKAAAVAPFLRTVEKTWGLTVYDTTTTEEIEASLMAVEIHRDFDDAMQYFVAKKLGAEAIVSYDRDFDGLDVPRKEPADLLKK